MSRLAKCGHLEDKTFLVGDCQNSSKPFRPDLDWSKWCLNLVYLRNNLKFRQGGGTWILNFRPSKYLDIHLKHRVPRPFSAKAIKNPSRSSLIIAYDALQRSVRHTLLPPI